MLKNALIKTIRGKIILITAAVTLLIAAVTVSICFYVFQSFLRQNLLQSAEYNLQVVSHNVASDMENILYFSRWCYTNDHIVRYLEAFRDQEKMPSISDNSALRSTALNAYNRLKEEYYNTHSSDRIDRVLISPANGKNYLQISKTSLSSASAAEAIQNSSFFSALYQAPKIKWIGFITDPANPLEQALPLIRPVYNQYNSEIVGWVYLSISADLIRTYLSSFPQKPDSRLYLTIGDASYQFLDGSFTQTELSFPVLSSVRNSTLNSDTQADIIRLPDGRRRTMVTCPLGVEGWSISHIISEKDYQAQSQVYLMIILVILFVIILMGLSLFLLLNRTISVPVKKIRARVYAIAQGDFSEDLSIEWEDELGAIGKGINDMSRNVVSLMNRKVEDEKQKKDLEYQILQGQINPHFLYNTLNSIKWMASIQNASGIAEMVTALARLLKNVSKGTSAPVPLKEELNLVKDYFLIQQYRYGGSISIRYQIDDDSALSGLIHRFTLQPLIENALFHGIEPKGCAGTILVKAWIARHPNEGPLLKISVEDNGVGMSEETIRNVLSEEIQPSADFFKQVGIQNVNRRIQHAFGNDYGISIESRLGEYTIMTITLPYKAAEGESV